MPDGSTPARRSEPMVLTARLSQVRIREPGEWRLAAIQSSTLGQAEPAVRPGARHLIPITQRNPRRYQGVPPCRIGASG